MTFYGIKWIKVNNLAYGSGLDFIMRSNRCGVIILDNSRMEWREWLVPNLIPKIPFGEYVSYSDYLRKFTKVGLYL